MRVPAIPGIPKIYVYAGMGIAAALVLNRLTNGRLVQETAAGAVGAVGGAGAGAVLGIGDVLGVPRTDAERCRQALENGESYNASLYCPAATYIRWEVSGEPKPSEGFKI